MSSKASFTKILETGFDTIDRHHTGYLEEKDLRKFLEVHGFSSNDAKEFLKDFDANKDGKVSKPEYVQALKKVKLSTLKESQLRQLFQKADKDNSGKVSKDELLTYLRKQENMVTHEEVAGWIEKYDKNSDKQLNYEEFLNFIRHML